MTPPPATEAADCFFERDPTLPLVRRATAEAVGTFLLVFTVTAAAIGVPALVAATPGVVAVGRGLAISATLTALIMTFAPVSGGHFNPLITGLQWAGGRRKTSCLFAYLVAQLLGAAAGARLATLVFATGPVTASAPPVLPILLLAELIATTGLMTIVLAAPRITPAGAGPFAVGGWIMMTIIGLPTAPMANPAIAFGLLLAGPAIGLSAANAGIHVAIHLVGALLAWMIDAVTAPRPKRFQASR